MGNSIPERVAQVRKKANLNQREFADKLNLSKSIISLAERGERNFTERTLLDICNKFNVNYEWLTTGEGEPYLEDNGTLLMLLKSEYNLDSLDIAIIEQYLTLSPLERDVFKSSIKSIIKKTEKG